MKQAKWALLFIMSTIGISAYAQSERTDTIKVSGNCGMCKKTIEKAANISGVMKADWNQRTKVLITTYDTSKISTDSIQKSIATSGYDTEKYKADDEAYNKLPKCCKYERREY